MKDKKYCEVRDHFHYAGEYRGVGHTTYNLKYNVASIIPIVFHNRSHYDYHFAIKQLSKQFIKQFT